MIDGEGLLLELGVNTQLSFWTIHMSDTYSDWLQTELEKLHPAEETEVLVRFHFTNHQQKSLHLTKWHSYS